jgi:ribosome assembly protein 1
LKIHPRELKSKDSRQLLTVIFSQWLSLSTCIIQAIIDVVPAPPMAQRARVEKMLHPDSAESSPEPRNKLEKDLFNCDPSSSSHMVAYVSKMFAVQNKELPENKRQPLSAEEMRRRARDGPSTKPKEDEDGTAPEPSVAPAADIVKAEDETEVATEETLLGFARIYAGTIHIGDSICAVLPKYNAERGPSHASNAKYLVNAKVQGLYTMMGRELVPVNAVGAGNVFAIRGLEGTVWRNATICAPSSGEEVNDSLVNLGALHSAVCRLISPDTS